MSLFLRLHTRLRPHPALGGVALLLTAMLATASSAHADSVTLIKSRIAMRGCEIQAIQSAQVFYLDPAGQRQRQPIAEVWALSFDNLKELDAAEEAIAEREYDTARKRLLEALIATDSPMQQLWIRNRLLRVHGLLGQYPEAAAHLAEIFILDPDQFWARMEPRCDATPTTFAAAKEAMEALARADRAVKDQAIQQTIDVIVNKLTPIFEELRKSYNGPPIASGATISGVLKSDIGTWDAAAPTEVTPPQAPMQDTPKPVEQAKPNAAKPAQAQPSKPSAAPAGPDAPASIDALLANEQYDEALSRCERIAATLDSRDLAEFLFQYGEALRFKGKPRDAAVMYMRGAVLFPASPFAGPCLIETALLYRDTFNRPETAKRLLERVAQDAARTERHELAERAGRLLDALDTLTP